MKRKLKQYNSQQRGSLSDLYRRKEATARPCSDEVADEKSSISKCKFASIECPTSVKKQCKMSISSTTHPNNAPKILESQIAQKSRSYNDVRPSSIASGSNSLAATSDSSTELQNNFKKSLQGNVQFNKRKNLDRTFSLNQTLPSTSRHYCSDTKSHIKNQYEKALSFVNDYFCSQKNAITTKDQLDVVKNKYTKKKSTVSSKIKIVVNTENIPSIDKLSTRLHTCSPSRMICNTPVAMPVLINSTVVTTAQNNCLVNSSKVTDGSSDFQRENENDFQVSDACSYILFLLLNINC